MADVGVALTWIALSAASVKGLSAFARAATTRNTEEEIASLGVEGSSALRDLRPINPPADLDVASV
jgi:hypothetical protein